MALNRREQGLIVAAVLLLAAVGTYVYVQEPLAAATARARNTLAQTHAQLVRDQVKLMKEGDLQERQLKLNQRLQVLATQVAGRRSATLFIYHLARAEQQSGVLIRQVSLSPGKVADGLLPVSITLQAEGSFLSHLLFVQALEGAPVFLANDQFDLLRHYAVANPAAARDAKPVTPSASTLARLANSPPLDGNYHLTLQIRPEADSPDTSRLAFDDALGRADPFAESALATLRAELANLFPGAQVSAPGSSEAPPAAPPPLPNNPSLPDGRPAPQMG